MAEGIDLEAALDELYATPPEGFTAARNALAKALRAEKRPDEAESVGALRKPGRLVWALNQLGLEDDDALEPLLEAADLVRNGGGDDLREAIADLREAVGDAAAAAARRLDPPRTTDRADLAQALLAIVADEDATDELGQGRLEDVPAPDAFGLGPSLPSAPKPASKPKPARKKPVKQPEGAERPPDQLAIKRATKRHKEAAKANDAAERALARAEKAVDDQADDLAQADADLADAKEAVEAAEAALAEARSQLEEATAAAAQAVDAQERAAGQLAEARSRAAEAAEELEAAQAELDDVSG
ncbi:MAG TPA: hypothetical protein VD926_07825 [Acidimicrobiales bacterium]|nr:hypothetical protein [Acidimicrobiales bacterium]